MALVSNPQALPMLTAWQNQTTNEVFQGVDYVDGLTMRDYFAATALAGLLAAHPERTSPETENERTAHAVKRAWVLAHFMLIERASLVAQERSVTP